MWLGIPLLYLLLLLGLCTSAQFIDSFNGNRKPDGWRARTGDGAATIQFKQHHGIGTIYIDATRDTLGIWWAIIHHRLPEINMKKLTSPGHSLRVEAKVRSGSARKRINLCVNHQRTTDYHANLMEYDLPDTTNWHVISMTARNFETRADDTVAVQLAMMDWGLEKYRLYIDYIKVDVVNTDSAGEDLGNPIPYHPPIADPAGFPVQVNALHDAVIDEQFTDLNFNNWQSRQSQGDPINILTTSGTQMTILRWDLSSLKGKRVKRAGLLEITPYSIQRSPDYKKDFGMVRVTEIIGGDADWDEKTVTYDKLRAGKAWTEVVNTQMIIDDSIRWNKNRKMLFTISQPVLQRMIDGKTPGIIIKPLGAVNASFYPHESGPGFAPKIYIDVE
ncbi:MAG: hypothetical protein JNK79_16625 [Chitinophagaceae bacterium]|nr:hypothetical protein [Chitinophagaceae bacterium]